MKDVFKLYAVYDIERDTLRYDLTSKSRKFWESKEAALKIAKRRIPERFKVVEINCQIGDFYNSETGECTI